MRFGLPSLKVLAMVSSVLLLLIGIALVVRAATFSATWKRTAPTLSDAHLVNTAAVGLTFAVIVILLSLFAISATCIASYGMLIIYSAVMGLATLMMLVYGMVLWIEYKHEGSHLANVLATAVHSLTPEQLDPIQKKFHCCGIERYTDYLMIWSVWGENYTGEDGATFKPRFPPAATAVFADKEQQPTRQPLLPAPKQFDQKLDPIRLRPEIRKKRQLRFQLHPEPGPRVAQLWSPTQNRPHTLFRSDASLEEQMKELDEFRGSHRPSRTRKARPPLMIDPKSGPMPVQVSFQNLQGPPVYSVYESNRPIGTSWRRGPDMPVRAFSASTEESTTSVPTPYVPSSPEEKHTTTTKPPDDPETTERQYISFEIPTKAEKPTTIRTDQTTLQVEQSAISLRRANALGDVSSAGSSSKPAPPAPPGKDTEEIFVPNFIWQRWDISPPPYLAHVPPYRAMLPEGEVSDNYWKVSNAFLTAIWQTMQDPLHFVCLKMFNSTCPLYERYMPLVVRNWLATLFSFIEVWRDWKNHPAKVSLRWWWGSGWDLVFFSQLSPAGRPLLPYTCCKNPTMPCHGRFSDTWHDGCKYKLRWYWTAAHVQFGHIFACYLVAVVLNLTIVYILAQAIRHGCSC